MNMIKHKGKLLSSIVVFSILFSTDLLIAKGQISLSDQQALKQTQKMLKDKNKRKKAISESPKAQKAHHNAVKTVGEENVDELYGISSMTMDDLVKQANGDPDAMQKILEQAAKDPEAFYNSLSPKTRDAIKGLAPKVKKPAH